MVEPLEPAAADSVFSDDLLLDLVGDPKGPPHQPHFQDILDADGLPVLVPETTGEGDEEEEELEWLSNKEAFPSVETSFEISAERPSPVSVLSAAGPPFRVPVKARSKGKRRRRRVMAGIVLPAAAAAPPARPMVERRRCLHCQSEETPQWRAGPEGPKTLCNACGVRYKSGRLVPEYRPANSPTFVAAVHSNSHRRIMEMRRRKSARGGRRGGRIPPEAAAL